MWLCAKSQPDDATKPECRPCLRAGYFVQPRRPHLLFLRAGRVGFSRLSQWLTWRKKANSSFGSTLDISVTWDHPKDQSECIIWHLTFCNITALSQALSEKDEEIKLKVEGHKYSDTYQIRTERHLEIFLSSKKMTSWPLVLHTEPVSEPQGPGRKRKLMPGHSWMAQVWMPKCHSTICQPAKIKRAFSDCSLNKCWVGWN